MTVKTAAEMMDEFGSPSGVLMNAISVLVDEIDWKENQTEKEKYLLEAWEEYHRRVKFPCPTCGIGEKRARAMVHKRHLPRLKPPYRVIRNVTNSYVLVELVEKETLLAAVKSVVKYGNLYRRLAKKQEESAR